MPKIVIDEIASGYSLSKINDQFNKIETYINDKVLSRDSDGNSNAMSEPLDMNSNAILNLPYPLSPTQPVRKIDLDNYLKETVGADLSLRQDLAAVDSSVSIAGVSAKNLARKYNEFVTVGDKDIAVIGFTAALQSALNSAPVDSVVHVPPGVWDCGEITLPDKNISIVGVGAVINATASRVFLRRKRGYFFGMAEIKFTGNGIAFDYDSDDSTLPNHTQYFEYLINRCRFHNGPSAYALRLYGAREGLVSECYFEGNSGVYTEFSINSVFNSCQWKNCAHMVLSKLGSEGLIVTNAVALGCSFGIRAERTTGVQIVNSMIDYCDSPVYLQGATDVLIQNNYISTRTASPAVHSVKYPDGFRGYKHVISGNNIRDNHTVAGSACIRYEETDFVDISDNILSNYASYGFVYTQLRQAQIHRNTTHTLFSIRRVLRTTPIQRPYCGALSILLRGKPKSIK